jgi:hypothetical protein
MARLVVLGAGFAGLWAAIGAARRLDDGEAAEILVIDRNPYHNIRVRNYEVDLSDSALPLADLLDRIYPPRTGRREDLCRGGSHGSGAPTCERPSFGMTNRRPEAPCLPDKLAWHRPPCRCGLRTTERLENSAVVAGDVL